MKTTGVYIILLMMMGSCSRLDDNLFNLSEKITEYKLDAYDGEQDFILDNSYAIPPDRIHLFTLSSRSENESKSTVIYALYIGDESRIDTDTVIMYCHGNKWHMDFYWQRAKLLAHMGGKNRYGVLMVDYRGYGLSLGEPTEDGMYADVDAALNWLKENGLTNNRLVMYGFSLGSAPACELTAFPRSMTPSKLILESPLASASVMVQDASQLALPPSFVTNLKIDNAEKIKNISQPFLWMHGDHDLFLNYKTHGEVVYNNYRGVYKEKRIIPGADHGEVPLKFGFYEYNQTLLEFISKD
jgi:pimeloyl-ACP methyl ester carboxylesterase